MVTGTMISWCMVMNNKMFSDIVPKESYSYVFALDRAVEGLGARARARGTLLGSCIVAHSSLPGTREGTLGALGQPIVGWLTDAWRKRPHPHATDSMRLQTACSLKRPWRLWVARMKEANPSSVRSRCNQRGKKEKLLEGTLLVSADSCWVYQSLGPRDSYHLVW